MHHYFLGFLIAFATDQLSKYLVIYGPLRLIERLQIDVFAPYLRFIMAYNDGINFGLLGGLGDFKRWILIAVAAAISVAVTVWILRHQRHSKLTSLGGGLLVGGALANVLDRLLHGAVLDFLNMSCCEINNPYVFNIADVWILVGAIMIAFFSSEKKPA